MSTIRLNSELCIYNLKFKEVVLTGITAEQCGGRER